MEGLLHEDFVYFARGVLWGIGRHHFEDSGFRVWVAGRESPKLDARGSKKV
jgi:hypothetical protein